MKLGVGTAVLFFLLFTQLCSGQTNENTRQVSAGEAAPSSSATDYVVFGATAQQEALVRTQIQTMQPAVLPLRVFFVPHWKYVENIRVFHLHVPTGYSSTMFTHLPSRTVFIDADRYIEESLGYWLAHELGHLAANSAKEEDAEKVARELRCHLKRGSH